MFFVDTNILVYLHDSKEPEKQDRAARILEHLWQSGSGRLSFQVLLEFYAVATRKLSPGLLPSIARREIQDLLDWSPLAPSASILDDAWQIQDRHGLSWWDRLIVAAGIAQDCNTLLTEDLQHGLIIGNLRVANPFHALIFNWRNSPPRIAGNPALRSHRPHRPRPLGLSRSPTGMAYMNPLVSIWIPIIAKPSRLQEPSKASSGPLHNLQLFRKNLFSNTLTVRRTSQPRSLPT